MVKKNSIWSSPLDQSGSLKSLVSYLGVNLTAVSALVLTLTGCSTGSPGDISTASTGTTTCTQSANSRLSTCTGTLSLTQNDSVQTAQASTLSAPTLSLTATIAPPTVNGTQLQANDVQVNGTTAFISYNTSGNTLVGGVDPISVLVPNQPVLGTGITFADQKINATFLNGSTLYAAGTNNNSGAVINTLTYTALTNTISSVFVQAPLNQSYAGVGVTSSPNGVLITTGDGTGTLGNGGAFSFTTAQLATASTSATSLTVPAQSWASPAIADARASVYDSTNGFIWTIAGLGKLYKLNATTGASVGGSYPLALGGNNFTQSKSTIVQGTKTVLVSLGDGGAKIVCKADGITMATIPAAVVSGLTSAQTPTNAAAAAPGILLLANGDAGVYVYYMTQNLLSSPSVNCGGVNVAYQGSINFGSTSLSANNVYWSGTAFFVATGLGGFKVVTAASLNLITPYSL